MKNCKIVKDPVDFSWSIVGLYKYDQSKVNNLQRKDSIYCKFKGVVDGYDRNMHDLIDEIDNGIEKSHIAKPKREESLVLVQSVRNHDVPVDNVDDDGEKDEEDDQGKGNTCVIGEEVDTWTFGTQLHNEDHHDLKHED